MIRKSNRSFSTEAAGRFARLMLRQRRTRERKLGDSLFSDPVWDMMLDLYAASCEGQDVCLSSLCLASSVAPSTAMRKINDLITRGHIRRMPDPVDGRRTNVSLSPRTFRFIDDAIAEVIEEAKVVAGAPPDGDDSYGPAGVS